MATAITIGLLGLPTSAQAENASSDHVRYWNGVLLKTYQRVGGAPGPLARSGAMMHLAIYDGANSIETIGSTYVLKVSAGKGVYGHGRFKIGFRCRGWGGGSRMLW